MVFFRKYRTCQITSMVMEFIHLKLTICTIKKKYNSEIILTLPLWNISTNTIGNTKDSLCPLIILWRIALEIKNNFCQARTTALIKNIKKEDFSKIKMRIVMKLASKLLKLLLLLKKSNFKKSFWNNLNLKKNQKALLKLQVCSI